MRCRLFIAVTLAALPFLAGACGTSGGGIEPEPAETLFYVSGGTGLQFELVSPGDTDGCPANQGTGIQGPNSNHQFPGRIFQTPHLFVLENAFQPVQAMIRASEDNQGPLTVSITIAQNPPQVANVQIGPGECKRVGVAPSVSPTPKPGLVDDAVEVCAPICTGCTDVDTNISCVGAPGEVDPLSTSISFFASIGDIRQSNISNCITSQTTNCFPPATFFLEQPKDQIAAVMQVTSGQAPGNGKIRIELYLNGERTDTEVGGNPIVQHEF